MDVWVMVRMRCKSAWGLGRGQLSCTERCCAKEYEVRTSLVIPTGHDPIDHFLSRKCIWTTHQTEGCQAPVDSVHPQMFGEVIGEFIAFLPR
jgi:hypothetical protein